MIPTIYAEWVTILKELAEGTNDRVVLENIQQGIFLADGQALLRLVKRFAAAIDTRINRQKARWSNMSYIKSELDLESELYAIRREFIFLLKVVNIPALTETYKDELTKKIKEYADETQQSLANSHITGVGRVEYIIRNNPVNRFDNVMEVNNDE